MAVVDTLEIQIKENVSNSAQAIEGLIQKMSDLAKEVGDCSSQIKGFSKEWSKIDKGDTPKAPVDDLGDSAETTSDKIKVLSSVLSTAKGVTSVFGKALVGVGKAAISVGSGAFAKLKEKVNGIVGGINNFESSLMRIAKYRFLRTIIKLITQGFSEGVKAMYQWAKVSGDVLATSLDSIATSLNYLKSNIGAMVSPLLNALAPAIEYLANRFVALTESIGQVFAALTGQDYYYTASKQATEYAESVNKVNKALMKFDELNVINSSSGGSSSSSGVASGGTNALSSWAEKIKEAINNGDWRGAGKALADRINDLINKLGEGDLGKRLGEKLNNAITGANGLFGSVQWKTLGSNIANQLNDFFSNIDPSEIGKLIANKFNMKWQTISGFVGSLDWEQVGSSIGKTIADAIANIDWKAVGDVFNKVAKGIATAIGSALRELSAQDIFTAVKDFFSSAGLEGTLLLLSPLLMKFFKSLILSSLTSASGAIAIPEILAALSPIATALATVGIFAAAFTLNPTETNAGEDEALASYWEEYEEAFRVVDKYYSKTGDYNDVIAKLTELGTVGARNLSFEFQHAAKEGKTLGEAFEEIRISLGLCNEEAASFKNYLQEIYDLRIKYNAINTTTGALSTSGARAEQFLLKKYATGGFPEQGSLALIGETVGDTEILGNVNGRTGVVGGAEITGIADAVYNTSNAEANLLREQNGLLRRLLAKSGDVKLVANAQAGKWIAQSNRAYAKATGV